MTPTIEMVLVRIIVDLRPNRLPILSIVRAPRTAPRYGLEARNDISLTDASGKMVFCKIS